MKTAKKAILLALKLFFSFCVAYVAAIIGRELISYGLFSFVFVMLSVGGGFFHLIKPLGFFPLLLTGLALLIPGLWLSIGYTALAF